LYILITYPKIFTGPPRDDLADTPDLSARELAVVGPLIAALLVLGFYPAPVLTAVEDEAAASTAAVSTVAQPSTDEGSQP
ncbi:MAG: hypothetical protein LBK72_04800, partial [Bifidobacteriaceae bacterium]|nr:hypothetical protein [Bifidobacteriaceae bacterium]